MAPAAPLRALIYTRISSDPTGLRAGVERQEKECRALAKRNGWEVLTALEDNDLSAWSGKKLRPGFKSLLAALDDGTADSVIAWHIDRLTRSPKELEALLDILDRRPHVRVATVQAGDLDLNTASGKAAARVLVTMSAYESDIKSARIREQKKSARERGEYLGSVRPFGMRVVEGTKPRRMEPHPEESVAVRETAERLLSGWSLASCTRKLNEDGWTTTYKRKGEPAGMAFQNQGVRAMMLRPTLNVIIGDELATSVHALLNQPGRRTGAPGQGRKRRYTGVLKCPCGAPLRGAGGPPNALYRCSDKTGAPGPHVNRRAAELDGIVDGLLLARLRKRDAIDTLAPDTSGKRAKLSAELRALDERAAEARGMFADGTLDAAGLRDVLARIGSTREGHASALAALAPTGSGELKALLASDDVVAAWADLSDDAARAVGRALLAGVTVGSRRGGALSPDDFTVEWRRA